MPCTSSIDSFVLASDAAAGIEIDALRPGTTLIAETLNSTYRFVILHRRRTALATGGATFHEPSVVRLDGATAGGSTIKMGWILVGYRLELRFESTRVRTSRVRSLSLERVR